MTRSPAWPLSGRAVPKVNRYTVCITVTADWGIAMLGQLAEQLAFTIWQQLSWQ